MGDFKEEAKVVIKVWNKLDGCNVNPNGKAASEAAMSALEKVNGDISKIRKFMMKYIEDFDGVEFDPLDKLTMCLNELTSMESVDVESDEGVQYSMSLLEKSALSMMASVKADEIEARVFESMKKDLNEFIMQTYGPIERKVVTNIDGVEFEHDGAVHEKFDEILKFIANDESVYLVGPSGSGKSVLCKQIAEALGLEFYFSNCVTREHMIDGFTDAMGNYHQTQFYKAFVNGGLFFLDEMDASIPEVLIKLNGALANGWYDFPAPIGKKVAHKDFKVIAAGNTSGQGASIEYVGRSQLDAASLDRFVEITIDYSPEIENSVALGNKELISFCRSVRKAAKKNGLNIILSYRGMGRIAKMEQLLELEEVLRTCLVKGMDKDDISMLLNEISLGDNKYVKALYRVMEEM